MSHWKYINYVWAIVTTNKWANDSTDIWAIGSSYVWAIVTTNKWAIDSTDIWAIGSINEWAIVIVLIMSHWQNIMHELLIGQKINSRGRTFPFIIKSNLSLSTNHTKMKSATMDWELFHGALLRLLRPQGKIKIVYIQLYPSFLYHRIRSLWMSI